ncbi:unnamed protein product [Ectocarpus sp. 4 AP-2014]
MTPARFHQHFMRTPPFLETGIKFSRRHGHTSRGFNTDGNPLALPLHKRRTDGRIHDKSELATIMVGALNHCYHVRKIRSVGGGSRQGGVRTGGRIFTERHPR